MKSGRRILVLDQIRNNTSYKTIPYTIPKHGINYFQTLQKYLTNRGLKVKLEKTPIMKRLILRYKNKIQRINFVLFEGTVLDTLDENEWKCKTELLLKVLSN